LEKHKNHVVIIFRIISLSSKLFCYLKACVIQSIGTSCAILVLEMHTSKGNDHKQTMSDILMVGDVAQWLRRQSLAGRLSPIYG